jgi:hypothetical protein
VDQEQSIGGSGRGSGADSLDMIHGSPGQSSGSSGSQAQAGGSSVQDHKMGGKGKDTKSGGSQSDDHLGIELGSGGGLSVPEQEQLGGNAPFPGQDQLGALGGQDQAQAELGHDTLSMGLGNSQDSIPSELDMPGSDMLQSDAQSGNDLLKSDPVNLTKRDSNEEPAKILSVKLKNGILKDALHRTGYISGGDPQFQ